MRGSAGAPASSRGADGAHELIARATDWQGRRQPLTVPFNDGGYLFWAAVRHPVNVTRAEAPA